MRKRENRRDTNIEKRAESIANPQDDCSTIQYSGVVWKPPTFYANDRCEVQSFPIRFRLADSDIEGKATMVLLRHDDGRWQAQMVVYEVDDPYSIRYLSSLRKLQQQESDCCDDYDENVKNVWNVWHETLEEAQRAVEAALILTTAFDERYGEAAWLHRHDFAFFPYLATKKGMPVARTVLGTRGENISETQTYEYEDGVHMIRTKRVVSRLDGMSEEIRSLPGDFLFGQNWCDVRVVLDDDYTSAVPRVPHCVQALSSKAFMSDDLDKSDSRKAEAHSSSA